jgi:hypothetical protein
MDTTKAKTPAQRAEERIIQDHDLRARKHACPGWDCATCSLHAGYDIAGIIADEYKPVVNALLELVTAIDPEPDHKPHLEVYFREPVAKAREVLAQFGL